VYLLLLLLLFWISLSLGKILRTSLETLPRWGVKLVTGIARGYLTLVDTSLAGSFSYQSHPAKAGKSVGVAANRQRPPCRYGRRRHLCVRLFRPHWLVVAARGVSCRSARRSRDTPSDPLRGLRLAWGVRRREATLRRCYRGVARRRGDAPPGSTNLRCTRVGEVSWTPVEWWGSGDEKGKPRALHVDRSERFSSESNLTASTCWRYIEYDNCTVTVTRVRFLSFFVSVWFVVSTDTGLLRSKGAPTICSPILFLSFSLSLST